MREGCRGVLGIVYCIVRWDKGRGFWNIKGSSCCFNLRVGGECGCCWSGEGGYLWEIVRDGNM